MYGKTYNLYPAFLRQQPVVVKTEISDRLHVFKIHKAFPKAEEAEKALSA
jgi:hypothetical protein